MYPLIKIGENIHFVSDCEPGQVPYEADLLIQKEVYQNGRKQGLVAVDEKTGKQYFVKVLCTGNLDDIFVQKESKVQLYSPFIIRIYGGMLDREKMRFLTLIEYRKEPDLSDLIRLGGLNHYKLEERMKIKHKIAMKFLYGISHYMTMYENDPIVHRDLKPENIMASDDGEVVKIIDFDWVHLHKSNVTVMTRREQKGTPGYAEPKYWDSYQADKRMDLYSAGLVLYFIYMEKHHFSGQDEISHYLMAGDYAYTLKPTPGLDEELRCILKKMIAREEERYSDIEEVIRDFSSYLKKYEIDLEILELLTEEGEKGVRLFYRLGPAIYSPVIQKGHFYPVEIGSRQLRSQNGILSSHILSFYYLEEQVKTVILDERCEKIISVENDETIIREGDQFRYADMKLEIMKIEEVDEA